MVFDGRSWQKQCCQCNGNKPLKFRYQFSQICIAKWKKAEGHKYIFRKCKYIPIWKKYLRSF